MPCADTQSPTLPTTHPCLHAILRPSRLDFRMLSTALPSPSMLFYRPCHICCCSCLSPKLFPFLYCGRSGSLCLNTLLVRVQETCTILVADAPPPSVTDNQHTYGVCIDVVLLRYQWYRCVFCVSCVSLSVGPISRIAHAICCC
ncbi:hypothetical protein B0O80DRAFT_455374 [Mortierella sp. GBAus27b]|nr:hypothetical protein B0O80DRAFT_455374 [Mortierella sp. GBAus27b]